MELHGANTRKIKSGQCKEDPKKIFSNWDKAFGKKEPNSVLKKGKKVK